MAKWRKTIASETPAPAAISLVVVPRKPRCENRRMATSRICCRRSPPAMRPPAAVAAASCLFVSDGLLIRLIRRPSQNRPRG
ncbi:MAG: hypothetical protein LC785_06280 [Acidobacteria bacterium]|nr:hypothetical protein [Acidobacteriota bacterium]